MQEKARCRAFGLSLWNWVVFAFKGKFGGGLLSACLYLLKVLNKKYLSKASSESLKKLSKLLSAIADFGDTAYGIYATKDAGGKGVVQTIEMLRGLSKRLEDGEMSSDEVKQSFEDLISAISAWKNAPFSSDGKSIKEVPTCPQKLLK